MATHRALVLSARDKPMSLEVVPRPTAKAGEAIVRVLAADIVPYISEVLDGSRPYPLSLPMTPGNTAIGRVEEIGPDAVSLAPGQLVFCDVTIRGRDDPSVTILFGIHGGGYPAAQKLMEGEWRNATYAEYAKFPLENLYAMNEDLMMRVMGYSLADLCLLPVCLVPFGGLSEVGIKPGEVVIVAPATGRYGGAAVTIALAMGANVIAAGRNRTALDKLVTTYASTERLQTVILTGDTTTDTEALKKAVPSSKGADAYIDFSPPAAAGRSFITTALRALRPFGSCVLMGGIPGDISVPYSEVMFKSLRLQGRFMYDRAHIIQIIKMVEAGILKLGKGMGVTETQRFGLDSIDEALKAAGMLTGWGSHVVLMPWNFGQSTLIPTFYY